jgi:hypothetical protein
MSPIPIPGERPEIIRKDYVFLIQDCCSIASIVCLQLRVVVEGMSFREELNTLTQNSLL